MRCGSHVKKDKITQFKRAGPFSKSHNGKPHTKKFAWVLLVVCALALGVAAFLPGVIDKIMEYRSDVRVVAVCVEFDGFEDYGGASVKEALTDGDKTYLLYPTFDNTSKALGNVRTQSKDCWTFSNRNTAYTSLSRVGLTSCSKPSRFALRAIPTARQGIRARVATLCFRSLATCMKTTKKTVR